MDYKRVERLMFILCFVVSQPLLISINGKLASVGLGRGVAGTAHELSSLRQPALCVICSRITRSHKIHKI